MKNIIVFTDYSKQSEHAARYAIHLAKKIKANILLSDAITVTDAVLALQAEGRNNKFEYLQVENKKLLNFCRSLENDLAKNTLPGKFLPAIYWQTKAMQLGEAINSFEESMDIAFIVLGVNLYYGDSSIMAGGICKKVLEFSNCPVIIVPEGASIRYAEKYGCVADINNLNGLKLSEVAKLAEYSAAEIMLVNINNGRPLDKDQENALRSIMKEAISEIDYGRIYYRHLPNNVLKNDMEWLMQDNRFEMMVIFYTEYSVTRPLLKFDYSDKLIGNINVPLLIYNEKISGSQ